MYQCFYKFYISPFADQRVFFEKIHGEPKPDGLAGVVEWHASREVNAKKMTKHNAQDLFYFCS